MQTQFLVAVLVVLILALDALAGPRGDDEAEGEGSAVCGTTGTP